MKCTILSKGFLSRLAVILVLVMVLALNTFSLGSARGIPMTTIDSVVPDVSVTISGTNFPANTAFTVRMGAYGTLAANGEVVGTKEAASGTTFTATYTIPASLVGASKIAIRFDSANGYYSYNWFENNTKVVPTPSEAATAEAASTEAAVIPAATALPTYKGIPTFSITAVESGVSVTIQTTNFPADQTFTVRMGEFGTTGKGGYVVGTTESGTGGTFTATYPIPVGLADRFLIAIRLDGTKGYYSYNWFYNMTTGAVTAETPVAAATVTEETAETVEATEVPEATEAATETTEATEAPEATETAVENTEAAEVPEATETPIPVVTTTTAYFGIPTFVIDSVVYQKSVTISGSNFPAGQTFTVIMGPYGSMGINGRVVTTFETGSGGTFTATYPIPSEVAGGDRIAIRLESPYYYSYNWFFNR